MEQENLTTTRLERENIFTDRLEQENIITNRCEQGNSTTNRCEQENFTTKRSEQENLPTYICEQENLTTNRFEQENQITDSFEKENKSTKRSKQEKEVPQYCSLSSMNSEKKRDIDLSWSEDFNNEENGNISTTTFPEQIIPENEKKRESDFSDFVSPKLEEKQNEILEAETVLVAGKDKTGTELEEEFFSLLDKLVTDLNTNRHTENIVVEGENIREKGDAGVSLIEKDKRLKSFEDEKTSLYSECSQDASTQTERIRRSKKCQIM